LCDGKEKRLMTRVLLTVLFVSIVLNAEAQRPRRQTIVMVDGSRLSGTIISDTLGYITMKITSPQIVTVTKSEVQYVETSGRNTNPDTQYRGTYLNLSVSEFLGSNEFGKVGTPGIHLNYGYQFRNRLSAGIGTGMENPEVTIMPLYAVLKYYPFKAQASPCILIKSGYGFAVSDRTDNYNNYYTPTTARGGFLFSVGAGVPVYNANKYSITIGAGYRYQRVIFTQEENWFMGGVTRDFVTHINRIELQVGFIFR
jgi:hypothetical protein